MRAAACVLVSMCAAAACVLPLHVCCCCACCCCMCVAVARAAAGLCWCWRTGLQPMPRALSHSPGSQSLTWLFVTPSVLRSHSGLMGRPSAASASPCRKNSCSRMPTHLAHVFFWGGGAGRGEGARYGCVLRGRGTGGPEWVGRTEQWRGARGGGKCTSTSRSAARCYSQS